MAAAVATEASEFNLVNNLIVIGFGVTMCAIWYAMDSSTTLPSAREREIRRISDTYGIDIDTVRSAADRLGGRELSD